MSCEHFLFDTIFKSVIALKPVPFEYAVSSTISCLVFPILVLHTPFSHFGGKHTGRYGDVFGSENTSLVSICITATLYPVLTKWCRHFIRDKKRSIIFGNKDLTFPRIFHDVMDAFLYGQYWTNSEIPTQIHLVYLVRLDKPSNRHVSRNQCLTMFNKVYTLYMRSQFEKLQIV